MEDSRMENAIKMMLDKLKDWAPKPASPQPAQYDDELKPEELEPAENTGIPHFLLPIPLFAADFVDVFHQILKDGVLVMRPDWINELRAIAALPNQQGYIYPQDFKTTAVLDDTLPQNYIKALFPISSTEFGTAAFSIIESV